MRVSITGVPATGKTTISNLLGKALGMKVIHLTELAEKEGFFVGFDEERKSKVVDIEKLKKKLKNEDNAIFESHFAEDIPADIVIVFRLDPEEVEQRLLNRGYSKKKAMENALAEALDYYTPKDLKGVFQVDTTGLPPYEIVNKVIIAIKEKKGDEVDFSYWMKKNLEKLEKLGL
jgi:adenylate kinase